MPTYITVGGSSGTGTGTSFGDVIEKVYRRVMGGIRERTVQMAGLNGGTLFTTPFQVGSNDNQVYLTGSQDSGIFPGVILAVDLELMYVISWDSSAQIATVERGYYGSSAVQHGADNEYVLAYINPRYSRYDIGVAINDDLRSLSSPTNGLFRVGVATLTYNPVFQGYDLGDLPSNFIDILEIRYRIAPPTRTFPAIKHWKVLRGVPDPVFPSGHGLILHEPGWPGLPIYVTYSAPFISMVSGSDDFYNTPATNDDSPPFNGYASNATPAVTFTGNVTAGNNAISSPSSIAGIQIGMTVTDTAGAITSQTAIKSISNGILMSQSATMNVAGNTFNLYNSTTVPNLPRTAIDLPALGAEIDLTLPREISRNFMESQPDPRKAVDIPAGSIMNSVNALAARRAQRISEEADRLQRQYTHVRSW